MNYRHAFHAGNFADVIKHLALVRVIERLKQKPKPFRYIDTHAGTGLYDLNGPEAQRSRESETGIVSLLQPGATELTPLGVPPDSELQRLLAPYFTVLTDVNRAANAMATDLDASVEQASASAIKVYPGGCMFARHLMRPDDRLVVNELHKQDHQHLRRAMRRDERIRVLGIDGWTLVKAALPPNERRGILMIDPPFEEPGEFQRLEHALAAAAKRFSTGVTLLWYPIKAGGGSAAFLKRVANSGLRRLLVCELLRRHPEQLGALNGSGLLVHNPTFQLDEELTVLGNWLAQHLPIESGGGIRVERLVGE